MPKDGNQVTAAAFLKNAKPNSLNKMEDFFAAADAAKKTKDASMKTFFAQVEEKAKADKAAQEAAAQKTLIQEVRGVLYTDKEYADMSALGRRWADIRTLAQIVRAGYVEGKREARYWFNHTPFGQAVSEKSKKLGQYGSACMDGIAKFYKNVKVYAGDGVDLVWRGMKAGYHYTAEKTKAAKDWFVNTAVVQAASRKLRKLGNRTAEAGKSMAHGFRKLFGIRELTEEEKQARAEEKRKKAEEKQKKAEEKQKEAEKKEGKKESEKQKLKEEKQKKKELEKKLKAFKKAIKSQKDPSVAEEMLKALQEATVDGLQSLGDRYDKMMKAIDLTVKSQVQKDDIDEIIRRRADKSYDARMKDFKEQLHNDARMAKKLKYRLNSSLWREEFEAAKKRAEEAKKKKQNGGKEEKKEEKKETKEGEKKEAEKNVPETKEENRPGIIDSINSLAEKAAASKKDLDNLKQGRIGNAADYVKAVQDFEEAYANLKAELKKRREEEEKKKAEAEGKTEEKTEEKAAENAAAEDPAKDTAESTEKTEEKSGLQKATEKAKEIVNDTVNFSKAAIGSIKTGIAIQENVGTIVGDVQKLVSGQGNEQQVSEAVKKSTEALKQAGSFFGWDPSGGTVYVDKGADTLALLGKTREDLTKRMEKIKNGTAGAEDYVAFETNLTTLAQNCLNYAKIDTPYINSFNKALTGMVEISKGKKVTENVLNVGQQILNTANAIEKQITGAGSLGTPIAVLGSLEKIAGNMEDLVKKTEQNQNLMSLSEEDMGKNLTKEDMELVRNGRDDIVGRNDISRYQLMGGAVKKAAETAVTLVGGTIGTLYVKAAQPAFDALHKFMNDAMMKSLDRSLIRKDFWGTEDNYRIDREMGHMRNDEIMRILRRETGSINGQHLADKIRFDLGMRLMTNADKDNGFEALAQKAFGRKATDEEIMQLVGFKDFGDAEKRVYKAAEQDAAEQTKNAQKPGKNVLAPNAKERKKAAEDKKKEKAVYDAMDALLDPKEDNALFAEDEKPSRKKISLSDESSNKNMVSFKNAAPQKKHKSLNK